ncbi:hypothetical protein ABE504_00655 [Paenibacillus oryzisoli]|uniref:hypothetical protein n=1 Tax=Paenibacillus oryzisoli TaxID=1850517 RepID=UPI003D2ADBED
MKSIKATHSENKENIEVISKSLNLGVKMMEIGGKKLSDKVLKKIGGHLKEPKKSAIEKKRYLIEAIEVSKKVKKR